MEKIIYTLFYSEITGEYAIISKVVSNDLMCRMPNIITSDGSEPNPFNMGTDWYDIEIFNVYIQKLDGTHETIIGEPRTGQYRTSTNIDSEMWANLTLGELFKSYGESRNKAAGGWHLVTSGNGFFDGPKTDCENLNYKDIMNIDMLLLVLGSWSGGDLTDDDPANLVALGKVLFDYKMIQPDPVKRISNIQRNDLSKDGKYLINEVKYSNGDVKLDTCDYIGFSNGGSNYDEGRQSKRDRAAGINLNGY